jgi:hypothetical protein
MIHMDEVLNLRGFSSLEARPCDDLLVQRGIHELEDIGALSACTLLARELVEGAWAGSTRCSTIRNSR